MAAAIDTAVEPEAVSNWLGVELEALTVLLPVIYHSAEEARPRLLPSCIEYLGNPEILSVNVSFVKPRNWIGPISNCITGNEWQGISGNSFS